jgi:hypothetical protein
MFKAEASSAAACTDCTNSGTGTATDSTAITACKADMGFFGADGGTPQACPTNSGTGTATDSTAITGCKADVGFFGADGETPHASMPKRDAGQPHRVHTKHRMLPF